MGGVGVKLVSCTVFHSKKCAIITLIFFENHEHFSIFLKLRERHMTYRVRTINPDRFDRPTGRKCEKKIQEFFFLIINQLSGRKKKKFLNFFFEFFIFIFECECLRHFGAAPALEIIGGHWRPFWVIRKKAAAKSVFGLLIQQSSTHVVKNFGKLGTKPKIIKYDIFFHF